jgi:hypothetical protein
VDHHLLISSMELRLAISNLCSNTNARAVTLSGLLRLVLMSLA